MIISIPSVTCLASLLQYWPHFTRQTFCFKLYQNIASSTIPRFSEVYPYTNFQVGLLLHQPKCFELIGTVNVCSSHEMTLVLISLTFVRVLEEGTDTSITKTFRKYANAKIMFKTTSSDGPHSIYRMRISVGPYCLHHQGDEWEPQIIQDICNHPRICRLQEAVK
jgi:hypothetical protein